MRPQDGQGRAGRTEGVRSHSPQRRWPSKLAVRPAATTGAGTDELPLGSPAQPATRASPWSCGFPEPKSHRVR